MIKKIVCLCLAISILTGTIVFAGVGQSEENIAKSVVTGLGFIEETMDPNSEITRGEFASIALRLYGLPIANEYEYGVDTPFADVNAEHYKSADILSVYKMGIMNGYGNGSFYPERPVALSEAVKILIDLLGYTDYLAYVGGYPYAYLTEAAKIGITDGIDKSYDSPVTYGEFTDMIYSILEEPVVEITGMGNDSIGFTQNPSHTFLSKYHDIYKGEGVVNATPVTRINGVYDLSSSVNTIEIASVVYNTETSEFNKLLGLNTEFYYKQKSGSKILVYAVDTNNKSVEYSGRDIIVSRSDYITVCDKTGKQKDYRLEQTGNVIYNGVFAGKVINYPFSAPATSLSQIHGTVRLTDTDDNGIYDVVFITEYKNYIVEKASDDVEKIFLKNNTGTHTIPLNYDTYISITKSGEEISLADLETGSVVSIADSNDAYEIKGIKRNVSVIVSDNPITASVFEIADNGIYLSRVKGSDEDGEFYKLAKTFFGKNNETSVTLQTSGVFYTGAMGEIVYYTPGDELGMQYGYLLDMGVTGGLDKYHVVKILASNSEIQSLNLADNINLDGTKTASSLIYPELERTANISGTIKQLVRYRLNSEGIITELDTSMANSKPDTDELTKTHVSTGATYKNNMKTFVMSGTDERYILPNDVKLFLIPTDPQASDDDYQVRSASYFSNNTSYGTSGEKLFVYNVKEAEPEVMELQIEKASLGLGGVSQYNSDLAVVLGHTRVAGVDGDEYISLKVMVTNAEKKLRINPDRVKLMRFEEGSVTVGTTLDYDNKSQLEFSDIKFGDLILYYEDNTGETRTVIKINDSDPRTWKHGSYGIQQKGGYLERMYGAVKTLNGRKLLLDISSAEYPDREIYANLLGSLQVYLVDFRTETVSTASFDDIIFSENDAYSDKVFVRTRSYVPKQVVIYRGVEVTK